MLNPLHWGALASINWGRSELAANLYDEILFHGATFGDLERAGGPVIVVGATELATGSRVVFVPQNFDIICADLEGFRLARAAAASSAVPVVLSPLTINNYGGTCGYEEPAWLKQFKSAEKPPGTVAILTKAAGVPIHRYSSESVELLRDIDARWTAMREFRNSLAASTGAKSVPQFANAPDLDIFSVEVSFKVLEDPAERTYLNELPTSFVLSTEQVDRLRSAAAAIVFDSPDLKEALKSEDVHILDKIQGR